MAVGLVLAAGVAALVAFRLPLANHLLAESLHRAGVPGQARVTALGFEGARLEAVSLEELEADAIDVTWDVSFEHGLVPTGVTVRQPSLRVDLTAEAAPFRNLRAALGEPAEGEERAAPLALPPIDVVDGSARIVTERGDLTADFDVTSEKAADGELAIRGRATVQGLGLAGEFRIRSEMKGLRPVRLDADLRAQATEGGPDSLTARLNIAAGERQLESSAEAAGRVSAGLAARLGLIPQQVAGILEFTVVSTAGWPDPAIGADAGQAITPDRFQAELDFHGEHLAWPQQFAGGELDWAGELAWDGSAGLARVRSARPLSLRLSHLARELLPPGLEEMLTDDLFQRLALSLEVPEIEIRATDRPFAVSKLAADEVRASLQTGPGDQLTAHGRAAVEFGDGVAIDVHADTRFSALRTIKGLKAVSGTVPVRLTSIGPRLDVGIDSPLAISMVPQRSILPESLSFLSGKPLRLRASRPDGQGSGLLRIGLEDDQLTFSQSGEVSVESPAAGAVRFRGRVAGRRQADDLEVEVDGGRLEARDIDTPFAGVDRLTATLGGQMRLRAGISSGAARIGFEPLQAVFGGRRISAGTGRAGLSFQDDGTAMLDFEVRELTDGELAVSARNTRISAQRSPDGVTTVVLGQATVQDLWLPKRFPPAAVSGQGRLDSGKVTGALRASPLAAPDAAIDLELDYELASGSGTMEFATSGLVFSSALQPKSLWPRLTVLERVRGALALNGTLDFDEQGLTNSGGTMNLSLAGFESGGMVVSDLSMPLELASLWPVESLPGQRLTIARIEDGAELTDVVVDYRLVPKPAGPPVLDVARAGMNLLGGRVNVGKATYDPDGDMETAVVEAEDLDLVAVLSMITREGLGGEGRLKGRFPVRMEGGALVVEDARLEAESPGILRFNSPEAAQTLSGAGDHVNLLLDALRNFHYDTLALSADKSAAGDLTLLLSMAGRNPDVLEGYPFNINLRLETDAAPLLATFRQGTDLFDEVVRRVWRPESGIR